MLFLKNQFTMIFIRNHLWNHISTFSYKFKILSVIPVSFLSVILVIYCTILVSSINFLAAESTKLYVVNISEPFVDCGVGCLNESKFSAPGPERTDIKVINSSKTHTKLYLSVKNTMQLCMDQTNWIYLKYIDLS